MRSSPGGCLASTPKRRIAVLISGLLAVLLLQNGDHFAPPAAPVQATAVLLQQNLNVNQDNSWPGAEYEEHLNQFLKLSTRTCGPFLAGMPELDAYPVTPDCPELSRSLPASSCGRNRLRLFSTKIRALLNALHTLALSMHAPVIAGTTSSGPHGARFDMYNSALFVGLDGAVPGRYDKIHLVPWGEYIPYKTLLFLCQEPDPAGRRHDPWMAARCLFERWSPLRCLHLLRRNIRR